MRKQFFNTAVASLDLPLVTTDLIVLVSPDAKFSFSALLYGRHPLNFILRQILLEVLSFFKVLVVV